MTTNSRANCSKPLLLIGASAFAENQTNLTFSMKKIIAVMSVAVLAAGVATAQNLLLNGDFNDPASTAAPTGWSTWNDGSGWENHEILTTTLIGGAGGNLYTNTGNYDGTYQMTLGNSSGSNWEGVYQVVAGTAGLTYTLSVDAGAQAWWWPNGYANIDFLDSTNGLLEQAQIVTTTSISGYDVGVPYQNFTKSAIAPAGTTQVKVELEEHGGGSAWFDNAMLTASVPEPTTLALLVFGGMGLFGFRRSLRI